MSRPQETNRKHLKNGFHYMNFTISSNYKLNKIVDSFKGIEDIEIDAKEIEEGVYDFIVSFKTSDDKIFHKKLRELFQIKKEDFIWNI